jgi:hypothetical protein
MLEFVRGGGRLHRVELWALSSAIARPLLPYTHVVAPPLLPRAWEEMIWCRFLAPYSRAKAPKTARDGPRRRSDVQWRRGSVISVTTRPGKYRTIA